MTNTAPVPLGSSDSLYMTAEEAASALNVSVPTLYTYVSRKNIRAHKTRGSRVSRYLRSDIEQIKSGIAPASARDTAPGLTGSSAITLMTEAGSFYRGVSAIDLAEKATLEDVARLLWDAGDFDPFECPATALPPQSDALLKACGNFSALDRAIMLLPAIEAANPRAHDLGKHGFLRSGADVLRWFAAWMLGQSSPARLPLHRYIGATTKCGPKLEDAVRRVLVLSADQALHPATYVARAAASTGATPYRCVIAGLSAATGKRLPAVRVGAFSRFLAEIDNAQDSTEPIRIRMRESEDIPGFGYSPFNAPDPRSAALWASLRVLLATDRNFARFERAIDLAIDLTAQQPDFALLAAYVNRRIGAEPDANLVRLGRIAGWVAHAWEQQNEMPLVRWKVNYNGVLPG
ncbi:citrate synthase [Paraburkholderia silvatlantica]|uniref:citrate synthase (unknown stereospecificity) n=1 Tax=Paraburkholderia silvatlantica TaxID=321895 RepID=A0A2V4TTJ2_9BURK|nr:citrate synthase family protein [Paraburkholderia silvatlantica]PYE16161.1 citrate synthase [Paraburkholderia silvatlantica]